MPSPLSVTDAARNFAEFINRVAYRGERFVLMRGRKAVAELRPVAAGRRLAELPALIADLPKMSDDDAASLAADIHTARSSLPATGTRDPWDS